MVMACKFSHAHATIAKTVITRQGHISKPYQRYLTILPNAKSTIFITEVFGIRLRSR